MSKEITETWSEFLERYPDLVFVRTKKQIYTVVSKSVKKDLGNIRYRDIGDL